MQTVHNYSFYSLNMKTYDVVITKVSLSLWD